MFKQRTDFESYSSAQPSIIRVHESSLFRTFVFVLYSDHIITSETGAQQGDHEVPPLFCVIINHIVQNITSELNIWYLDDDSFAGEYSVVFKVLKFLIREAEKVGLTVNFSKCKIVFFNDQSVTIRQRIMDELNLVCYGFGIKPIEDLVILGSPVGYNSTIAILREKTEQLRIISQELRKIDSHFGFFLLKSVFHMPK